MWGRAFFFSVLVVLGAGSEVTAQRARRRIQTPAPTEQPGDQYRDHPRCIEVLAQPVFNGVGWNHVVVIRNGCERAYACRIATNVDPTPEYPVTLAPGEQRSVATRNGSPASGFTPTAVCR